MRDAYGPRAWALCLALVGCGSTAATPSLRLDSGAGAQSGAEPMLPMGYTPATDGGGATGDQGPPPADSGTPPPTDAGGPMGDGGMMGPRTCTSPADCPLNACPPGAVGCTCAMGASTMICISTCTSTPDCPTISGMPLVCETARGVCVPMM